MTHKISKTVKNNGILMLLILGMACLGHALSGRISAGVASDPPTYKVNIVNGNLSNGATFYLYPAQTQVTIKAALCLDGVFDHWDVQPSSAANSLLSSTASVTVLTVPAVDVAIEAFYTPLAEPLPAPPAVEGFDNFINQLDPNSGRSMDIGYTLTESKSVSLKIYDLRGYLIKELPVDSSAGSHVSTWDGRNERGTGVSSGVYLLVLKLGGTTYTKKVLILK